MAEVKSVHSGKIPDKERDGSRTGIIYLEMDNWRGMLPKDNYLSEYKIRK